LLDDGSRIGRAVEKPKRRRAADSAPVPAMVLMMPSGVTIRIVPP